VDCLRHSSLDSDSEVGCCLGLEVDGAYNSAIYAKTLRAAVKI